MTQAKPPSNFQSEIQTLSNQLQRLHILVDVARSIMAEIGLDSLLGLIMESVTKVMVADRSSLFLIDHKSNELWSRVAQGAAEIRLPLGYGVVGDVALSGKTANIADAYLDKRFSQDFDKKTGYRTKSILCMPINNVRGEIIGAIQVLNKLDGQSFTQNDEDLLSAFSSLAGISIENARAYEELEKERNSLEIKVRERTKDLESAKKKSDELLLNILPEETAEELKTFGKATTKAYDMVTVLFTDFKGFTMVAETMTAEALVQELDLSFAYFDEIVGRLSLEKIKTIGDSYMCAGGIPIPNASNPLDVILAAMKIQAYMEKNAEMKTKMNEPYWELRIGIHTGPVVAGVVGKKKFAYDIWGDTVNTASRMESSGAPGKINISGSTYDYAKDYFECTYRGKVKAKNKGAIDMYFVERLKAEYSKDKKGRIPNKKFLQVLQDLQKKPVQNPLSEKV
ncbi:MAG: adenylate/guanylate cyclase domain-containing protein [Spirochaetota bacterium]